MATQFGSPAIDINESTSTLLSTSPSTPQRLRRIRSPVKSPRLQPAKRQVHNLPGKKAKSPIKKKVAKSAG